MGRFFERMLTTASCLFSKTTTLAAIRAAYTAASSGLPSKYCCCDIPGAIPSHCDTCREPEMRSQSCGKRIAHDGLEFRLRSRSKKNKPRIPQMQTALARDGDIHPAFTAAGTLRPT